MGPRAQGLTSGQPPTSRVAASPRFSGGRARTSSGVCHRIPPTSSPRSRGPKSPLDNGAAYTLPRDIRGALVDRAPELVEQIDPLRVHALDQPDLPGAIPLLESLLALNGGVHRQMHLIIRYLMDTVALGEALDEVLLVNDNAAEQ